MQVENNRDPLLDFAVLKKNADKVSDLRVNKKMADTREIDNKNMKTTKDVRTENGREE